MYDRDTFIQIAPDCPAADGMVPESNRDLKPFHVAQFEVLSRHPYRYTYAELLCEAHARQNGLKGAECRRDGDLRQALLKKHPCPRTCALPKRFGWGIHVNGDGKLALHGCESDDYRRLAGDDKLQHVAALRSKRAM